MFTIQIEDGREAPLKPSSSNFDKKLAGKWAELINS